MMVAAETTATKLLGCPQRRHRHPKHGKRKSRDVSSTSDFTKQNEIAIFLAGEVIPAHVFRAYTRRIPPGRGVAIARPLLVWAGRSNPKPPSNQRDRDADHAAACNPRREKSQKLACLELKAAGGRREAAY